MSRSGYSDDCETIGLWRGSVYRATVGPRGQRLIREMIVALEAMPSKELADDLFVDGDRVCAMGAVAVARGIAPERLARLDETDPGQVGRLLDIPRSLAAEIAYENDEWAKGDDEDRWRHMHSWAVSNLVPEQAPTPKARCSWCCERFTLRDGVLNRHKYLGGPCPGVGLPPFEVPT
jgi:hypothetical protein